MKAGLCSLVLAVSSNADATEAKIATPEQIAEIRKTQNTATGVNRDNEEDWSHQEDLMIDPKETVLIQAVQGQPGYCVVGINGYTQVYDPKFKDTKRTGANNEIDLGERILNLAEKDSAKKFYFPCDLKAEPETPNPIPDPNAPIVPGPNGTEKKSTKGNFGVSIGYTVMGTAKDAQTESDGVLHGATFQLTSQSSKKGHPWFGVALSLAGNYSALDLDLTRPAVDGPLAGQLVMKGTNEFSLQTLSLGAGVVVGGEVYANKKNTFGLGIEGLTMVMYDREQHKFGESSAQYINGNIVEGSDISNHSDRIDSKGFLSNQIGLRLRFDEFCLTPKVGFRTNFSDIYPVGAATLGYCPKQE